MTIIVVIINERKYMLPSITMGAMSALSIGSSLLSNASNAAAFVSNAEQVYKDYDYQIKQLQDQAKTANDNIALEMTSARWDFLKQGASTTNSLVERNIAGNSAVKAYNQSSLNAMFAHNALAKKAEDTMKSFGIEFDNTRQNANNAIYSAAAMAKKQNISTLGMTTSAVQAGMSGYAVGSSFGSIGGTSASIMGSSAGGAGGFTSYTEAANANYSGGF